MDADLLAEIWTRLTRTTPAPVGVWVWMALVAAAVLLVVAWRPVRMLATVCHESGHALVAVLTGRRLHGVRLHADTSGLTLSSGRPRGPGMVATVWAGYPAASVLGLAAVGAAVFGRAGIFACLAVVASGVLLISIRNLTGAGVVLTVGVLLGLLAWYAPGPWLAWLVTALGLTLLLAGPRTVVEAAQRPRRAGTSDADLLASLTWIPRPAWFGIWLTVGLGCLALAGWWLWGAAIPA